MADWDALIDRIKNPKDEVDIALVGKYSGLHDSYMSLNQALAHGGFAHRLKVNIHWIEAENLEKGEIEEPLAGKDGILVPGGFGGRGIEGKIRAVAFARENKIPFFGICLGMQCASIEFARNVAGLAGANSTEFDARTPHRIITLWRELKKDCDMGGTMRLGQYACRIAKGTAAFKAYGRTSIKERHRHRYEFNPKYEKALTDAGLLISGRNPDYGLVEIVELRDHPWFLGCQFHPEFKSKPVEPHPLFKAFIGASYANRIKKDQHRAGN